MSDVGHQGTGELRVPRGKASSVRPTIIERLNQLIPLPYFVSCMIVAALIGPLGFFILDYLTTFDIARASHPIFYSASGPYTLVQLLGNNVAYPAVAFYCAYMIRFMRKKIVSIESDLVDRSPEWGATILSSFGRISRALPPLLITVAMTVVLSPLILSQVQNNSGANQYYFAISYPIFFFGAGTFIWTYASALWGLNEIGRRPIRLRSFREDALMGLGGFGSIALSLTFVFFVAVFLGTLLISAFASDLPLVLFGLFTGVLTLLGLAVFFLPLENIHSKMRAEKERLHQAVVARIVELSRTDDSKGGAATSLKDTLLLEDELKDIEALPTWPFDTPIIGRLIIVVLSIIVSIVSRLILASLNL